ncbi:MAG TPA: DUF4290 domain-containing protein, partial [Draconibacterium sp.]|nr:DUF4290 domain-containing protein [Draconibacterium sp.]
IMEKMIERVADFEGEEKDVLINLLANHMKKSFLAWNKDAVEDSKILMDLEEISGDKIKVNQEMKLAETKNILSKSKKKKKSGKSNQH